MGVRRSAPGDLRHNALSAEALARTSSPSYSLSTSTTISQRQAPQHPNQARGRQCVVPQRRAGPATGHQTQQARGLRLPPHGYSDNRSVPTGRCPLGGGTRPAECDWTSDDHVREGIRLRQLVVDPRRRRSESSSADQVWLARSEGHGIAGSCSLRVRVMIG